MAFLSTPTALPEHAIGEERLSAEVSQGCQKADPALLVAFARGDRCICQEVGAFSRRGVLR